MNDIEIIKIQAGISGKKGFHNFYMYCDPIKARQIPPLQMKKTLREMLKNVRLDKSFSIHDMGMSYVPIDPKELRQAKKNTFIQVTIPFCLNIPQACPREVNIPEKNISAWVALKKVWTNKSEGSDNTDLFAEDVVTYYSKSECITPTLPQSENDGWELLFTGKNITKAKDNTGYFRYSKLSIEIDTFYDKDKLMNNRQYSIKARKEIVESTLEVINRILDIYRFVTKETHIERLSSLDINIRDIYFVQHNMGFIGIMMGEGIENAVMNRSKKEIEKLNKMLKDGDTCPLFELLFLNAEASYNKRMFTLALVESFQALEIFLENFLISKYRENSLNESEIQKNLSHTWRTKERLKKLLPEVGIPAPSSNSNLWNAWCTMYDRDRKQVIHKGKEITKDRTRKAIDLNKTMVSWINNNSHKPPPEVEA